MRAADPRTVFPDSLGEINDVQPIKIGMSGAGVFAVSTAQGEFVVRFHGGDPQSWSRMIAAHRVASEAGVAPKIYHVDADHQATVTERITYFPIGAALANPEHRQRAMTSFVDQLRKLHGVPLPGVTAKDPLVFARQVFSEQAARKGFPAWAKGFGSRLGPVAAALAGDRRSVLSHCDLNPANVLWDGTRIWFVDWEDAAPAHPFLDLAIFTNFVGMPDADALRFLAAQEGRPLSPADQDLFGKLRDLARVVYASIFLRLIPDLTQVAFLSKNDSATLAECFASMMQGKLLLHEPQGRAAIASAFFKQL